MCITRADTVSVMHHMTCNGKRLMFAIVGRWHCVGWVAVVQQVGDWRTGTPKTTYIKGPMLTTVNNGCSTYDRRAAHARYSCLWFKEVCQCTNQAVYLDCLSYLPA